VRFVANLPAEDVTADDGVSVVIPVYNEEDAVLGVIQQVQRVLRESDVRHEVIAVDDGSTDDSCGAIAEASDVTLVKHPANRGYGAALKTGIRRARYERVAIIDADGTYAPESLAELLAHWGDNDMVVGARVGRDAAIPAMRRPAKWFLNQAANYLVGVKIPDLNSGLRVFRKSVALRFFNMLPSGFSFTTTITLAMLSNDYLVAYVPIPYAPRIGSSKIRPIRDTANFLGLILRTFMYFAPLKVFAPVSLAFLLVALVKTVSDIVAYQNVTTSDLLLWVTGTIIGMMGLLADLIDKRS
jgi:glycosyltransferase involved in cell wall biosynthesis